MTTQTKAADRGDTQTAYETVRTGHAKHSIRRAVPVSFILPIDDRYRLTADERGWRIEQRHEGGEWRPVEYHTTIDAAVSSLGGSLLSTPEVRSLADVASAAVENVASALTLALASSFKVRT